MLDRNCLEGFAREVSLPDGRMLRIRPVAPTDRGGLRALFDGLSAEDRHLRYFSFYRPPRSALDRLVRIEERGGCSLVAEVSSGARPVIVGEADFEPEDGEIELGIVVDHAWRGWLGPYLLDCLLAVARRRGFERILADVLLENRPMLALARSRGSTVVGRPDLGVVRLAIPTVRERPPNIGAPGLRQPQEDPQSAVRDDGPERSEHPALGGRASDPYREHEGAGEVDDARAG